MEEGNRFPNLPISPPMPPPHPRVEEWSINSLETDYLSLTLRDVMHLDCSVSMED